ncbi:MAG TPA: SDR family oxidoreductase [Candidatus Saccharimonadales bacterium]|nr:SDR family oxidoreductase [Candidatus Saccharimonadales bacterium]
MILVTGATGTVGREVVAQLLQAGQSVRAMTRNPAKARIDSRVEVVTGDFRVPDTLAQAVEGTERVFSLTYGPQTGVQERSLARAAKAAGVRHIVKLSALGGDNETRNTIRKWHDEGEQAIRDTGIAVTVLRPGAFMSNALHWRESIRAQGKVFSNYGDGKLPPVHPRDIAAVAVRALTADGHEGRIYPITGPEALSVSEQVRILSDATGKRIEYVPVTDEAARTRLEQTGMPAFLIDALLPFAAFIRSGRAAEVVHTVEEVTGRPALTFSDWAQENAPAFR